MLYSPNLLGHDFVIFVLSGWNMPLTVLCAYRNFTCLQDRRPDLAMQPWKVQLEVCLWPSTNMHDNLASH